MPPHKRKIVTTEETTRSSDQGASHENSPAIAKTNVNSVDPSPKKRRKAKDGAEDAVPTVKHASNTPIDPERASQPDPVEEQSKTTASQRKRTRTKAVTKAQVENEAELETTTDERIDAKPKRKRKTKEEKDQEAMPLAARTIGHKLYIGAHVSSAGGVQNAVINSVHIGANAFALFLKSQRKWANPSLSDDACSMFLDHCNTHSYDQTKHVVPHGSYLVNLAHTDQTRTEQAYESFLDDLRRCESLGIRLYNFHPGVANSVGGDRQAAIRHLASNLNRAHRETKSVVTLLENMAAGGNVLGSTFEDLRDIIALIDDKKRIGVCFDTCHAFAAGYDLRSPDAFKVTFDQFEDTVGFRYLRALHVNDSKAPFASHRDLHANIGTGFLGLRAFHNLVNERRLIGLPLVLETPIDAKDENGVPLKDEKGREKEDKAIWATEIKLLESLVGMDVKGDEFVKLETELARKGKSERDRLQAQFDQKLAKQKAMSEKPRRKKKNRADSDEDETD